MSPNSVSAVKPAAAPKSPSPSFVDPATTDAYRSVADRVDRQFGPPQREPFGDRGAHTSRERTDSNGARRDGVERDASRSDASRADSSRRDAARTEAARHDPAKGLQPGDRQASSRDAARAEDDTDAGSVDTETPTIEDQGTVESTTAEPTASDASAGGLDLTELVDSIGPAGTAGTADIAETTETDDPEADEEVEDVGSVAAGPSKSANIGSPMGAAVATPSLTQPAASTGASNGSGGSDIDSAPANAGATAGSSAPSASSDAAHVAERPAGAAPASAVLTPIVAIADVAPRTQVQAPTQTAPVAEPAPLPQDLATNRAQIMKAVTILKGEGGPNRLTLALEPGHLGQVRVELVTRNGMLSVDLTADGRAGVAAINSSLAELRQQLISEGVQIGDLNVGLGGNQTAGGDGEAHGNAEGGDARPNRSSVQIASHQAVGTRPHRLGSNSGLDLSL